MTTCPPPPPKKGELKLNSDPEDEMLSARDASRPRAVPAPHPCSAQPQSPSSPRAGLILVSGQPRLDNSCTPRQREKKKGKTCLQASHPPPPEMLLPGAGARFSAFCSKNWLLYALCWGQLAGTPLLGCSAPQALTRLGCQIHLLSLFPPVVSPSIYLKAGILKILGDL